MRISGDEKHLRRLKNISGPKMTREAGKLVLTLAKLHADQAAKLITTGAVSGRNHVASKPGEAPNADTHTLDRSIEAVKTGQLTAESSANTDYAATLEVGNSKIEARPFMKPAAKIVRKVSAKLARAAVDRIKRGAAI